MRTYSLRKSRGILKTVYTWFKRKSATLSSEQRLHIERQMLSLDQALIQKNREEATVLAKSLESFADVHCKKSILDHAWELAVALIFALAIAVVVRQMWFELYEIPTGSMRPTFKEKDRLTVTKTAFGLNVPLETKHFYFDPSLVQRTSIFIFSGGGIPALDFETKYFGILPYTKRYIKRNIAKPGDSIYFYGGKIYGVDDAGNDIKELREAPWMERLEYIPFLNFNGQMASNGPNSIIFKQMDMPVGKLTFLPSGKTKGEVFNGKTWVPDSPASERKAHDSITTYSDFLGMRNFAIARILTKQELPKEAVSYDDKGILYLQLFHTPNLTYPAPLIQRVGNGASINIIGYSTIIPLQQKHLDAIMNAMYTARFVVADGQAKRYDQEDLRRYDSHSPSFPGIPDGIYEFYFGRASKIYWGGISSEVPSDSPLYAKTPENVQKLYNLGIEFNTEFIPKTLGHSPLPNRYAYFRDGDLYLLGEKIFDKHDPILVEFLEKELEKEKSSSTQAPYVAFKDQGPPIKDGKLDTEFIRTFGYTVPEKHYLALGDNHAMSSDSRVFGAVPEDNLQGAPNLVLWPPGNNIGHPAQKPYPFMNIPRAIVWTIAAIVSLLVWLYYRWKHSQPMVKLP